jgi:hypothetical protein
MSRNNARAFQCCFRNNARENQQARRDRSHTKTTASHWSVGCSRSAEDEPLVAYCFRTSESALYDRQGSWIRPEHHPTRPTSTGDVINPSALAIPNVAKAALPTTYRVWLVRQLTDCKTNLLLHQQHHGRSSLSLSHKGWDLCQIT